MKEINDATFEAQVEKSSGLVVVDFSAVWCGPCKQMAPILEMISSEQPAVKILKIDVDDNPESAQKYGIRALPSMVLFKDGKEVSRKIGSVSKSQIEKWIADGSAIEPPAAEPPPAVAE